MKILFIIPKLGGGGAEVLLGAVSEELVIQGHQVKIICLHAHHETFVNFPNRKFIEEKISISIINDSVSFSFFKSPKINNELYKNIVNEFQPDIIHSHLFESELLAYSFIKSGIKYFSHAHDNMVQLKKLNLNTFKTKSSITNFYESIWLKRQYRKANANFIAISQDSLSYLKTNLSKNHKKNIFSLQNAINLKGFYNVETKSSSFSIVSTGNLVPKKGHLLLVNCASELKNRGYNFKIEILGYGLMKDQLESKISELNLKNNVILAGNVSNVNDFLSRADLYVHTATYEPFGLAIIEAMASNLPVVCTDGKGNRDLIQEGINGFMVWERDPKLLADKIELLINDEEKRNEMGTNARKFSEGFGIEQYVQHLLLLYSK